MLVAAAAADPIGVAVYTMLSGNRHWLEYDSVGIGFVALIVLGI
jgi:hypothetical protein